MHRNIVVFLYVKWFDKSSFLFFFLLGFFFTDTDNSEESPGREGTIFYSTLPPPPAHGHSGIYLQLCAWDDYPVQNF